MNISMAMNHGDLEEVAHHWGWHLALGITLIVLGIAAGSMAVATTIMTVVLMGAVLAVSGVLEIISAIRHQGHHSFWLQLLAGVLDGVVGVVIMTRPLAGAVVLTLMLAAFFLVGGVYRAVAAISLRLPQWGWSLVSGGVDVLLGIMLLSGWPVSGLWFIGLCIGIGLVFRGWAWVMLSLFARSVPPAIP